MSRQRTFLFDNFTLDLDAAELKKSGAAVDVEPQVFDLIALLAGAGGRVVTRDEIIDAVWKGQIVSDSAISTRINAARRALGDDGTKQRYIKTIHGRGFRWEAARAEAAPPERPRHGFDKPAIAVLPFVNMSGDPDQEYFADGVAEEIITALSRFRSFLVIARNTTFTFKHQNVDVTEISGKLNARYVVEGSVRKAGNRVRVTAQLIDGADGAHIWADRFDGVLEDIFDLQDKIATAVVTNVAPQSTRAEVRRALSREARDELGVWDLLMRARWYMCRYTSQDSDEAIRLFNETIRRDPQNAQAYAWLALSQCLRAVYAWTDDPQTAWTACSEAAALAMSCDPTDAMVHAVNACPALFERQFEKAVRACQTAIKLNPNLALAHGILANVIGLSGSYDDALVAIQAVRRLSPLDPDLALFLTGVGMGALAQGRYVETLEATDEIISLNPRLPAAYRQRTVAFVELGDLDAARRELGRLLELTPRVTAAHVRANLPAPEAVIAPHIAALKKAGLPD